MIQLKVGDHVYEARHYKKTGVIGHILEDRERYGAPYSVTFDNPDPDQPGRDYFSADELRLLVPLHYQTEAEKAMRERLRQIEQLVARIPEKPYVEGLAEWEVGAERAEAAMAKKIRQILHSPVDMPH
jgi:hypothetical protein